MTSISIDHRRTSTVVMPTGDVARQTGLGVHALRFYERNELLVDPIERTPGGRRVYSETDVEWLTVCVKLRESGMPLADMRRFAALVRQGQGNESDRLGLLQEHEDSPSGPVMVPIDRWGAPPLPLTAMTPAAVTQVLSAHRPAPPRNTK